MTMDSSVLNFLGFMRNEFLLRFSMRYFICLVILAVVVLVDGQPGFVSIDCGFSRDGYNDSITKIKYTPDADYIDTGSNHEISDNYTKDLSICTRSLRSFSEGIRNCYTINNVLQGSKYLIRASFLYGNYNQSKENQPIKFDLYLGVDLWQTMNITNASQLYSEEIITMAYYNYFSICLVNTGNGTPFISSLELRLILSKVLYSDVNQTVSLRLLERKSMGSCQTIRYPDDKYDRIWWLDYSPCSSARQRQNPYVLYNANSVRAGPDDPYEVPSTVMQTAAIAPDNVNLTLNLSSRDNEIIPSTHYIFLHFAELENLTKPDKTNLASKKNLTSKTYFREFQVRVPFRQLRMSNISPEYLVASHVPLVLDANNYELNLTRTSDSTVPPLLNAFEVYSIIKFTSVATDQGDVDAMKRIKKLLYSGISTWQGDPCFPIQFTWDGINCSSFTPPRITSLNLSYFGLKGTIPDVFAKLTAIEYLDLSNNYLTGTIPAVIANLNSLQTLDLSHNKLDGSIPSALCSRQAKGLKLRLDDNPCNSNGNCACSKRNHHSYHVLIISVVIAAVAVLILLSVSVFFIRRGRGGKKQPLKLKLKQRHIISSSFNTENPSFTYQDLRTITNNFERVLGKGGFGTVYYGRLPDGIEVAVKMQRRLVEVGEGITEELMAEEVASDSHGIKEFQAEAQLLSRVHHRNLVSLVGYCKDGFSLGLVFEYAAQGSLKNHLSGIAGTGNFLTWRERLRIAVDSAKGLEYLHKGCKPPIIHRDVKSSNILLSDNFEAKISDFGLSKAFLADGQTHVSTHAIAGTPGYMDPEYHNTFRLTEKSDVYGFGIVLLELLTGLPAVIKLPETSHILEWVHQRLSKGNLTDAVDPKLGQQYDIYSVEKFIGLAMSCTALDASERPDMTAVLIQLKKSLQLEIARECSMSSTYIEALDVNPSDETGSTSSMNITELSFPVRDDIISASSLSCSFPSLTRRS